MLKAVDPTEVVLAQAKCSRSVEMRLLAYLFETRLEDWHYLCGRDLNVRISEIAAETGVDSRDLNQVIRPILLMLRAGGLRNLPRFSMSTEKRKEMKTKP